MLLCEVQSGRGRKHRKVCQDLKSSAMEQENIFCIKENGSEGPAKRNDST